MRVELPLGNAGVAHLFVIHGYQGAEVDPQKLSHTDRLQPEFACSGQTVTLVGDVNADPPVIPL